MSERMDSVERLRRFAERTLDESTYERVVLPAIADVRHECDGQESRVVCIRAHWGLWKTLAVCLLLESGRVARPTVRGVVVRMSILFPIVGALVMIPPLGDGAREWLGTPQFLLLSLPQAAGFALLVAYFFALVMEPESVPPRRLLPAVFGLSLACTLGMTALTMSVVPRATAAFCDSAAARLRALNPGEPVARPSFGREQEWTFTDLVRKSIDGGSPAENALARHTLSKRLALSTMPIMVGFVGLAISGYSMKIALFNGVWVVILYIAVGRACAQSSMAGPSIESVWLINGLFTLAGFCLVFRRPGAIGAAGTRLPSPR
jgi:hypothetical protein